MNCGRNYIKYVMKRETKRSGIDCLVNYYITTLGWSEVKAIKYTIDLFHSGTIKQIKMFGKDGNRI